MVAVIASQACWMDGGRQNATYRPDPREGNKKTKLGGQRGSKQRRGEERREALLVATQSHGSRCHRAFGFPLTPSLSPFCVQRSHTQPVRCGRPERSREDCAHHFYNLRPARRRRLSRGAAGGHLINGPFFVGGLLCSDCGRSAGVCVCVVCHSLKTHKPPPLSRRSGSTLRSATQELMAKFDFES